MRPGRKGQKGTKEARENFVREFLQVPPRHLTGKSSDLGKAIFSRTPRGVPRRRIESAPRQSIKVAGNSIKMRRIQRSFPVPRQLMCALRIRSKRRFFGYPEKSKQGLSVCSVPFWIGSGVLRKSITPPPGAFLLLLLVRPLRADPACAF